jgi:hypothetical protein
MPCSPAGRLPLAFLVKLQRRVHKERAQVGAANANGNHISQRLASSAQPRATAHAVFEAGAVAAVPQHVRAGLPVAGGARPSQRLEAGGAAGDMYRAPAPQFSRIAAPLAHSRSKTARQGCVVTKCREKKARALVSPVKSLMRSSTSHTSGTTSLPSTYKLYAHQKATQHT